MVDAVVPPPCRSLPKVPKINPHFLLLLILLLLLRMTFFSRVLGCFFHGNELGCAQVVSHVIAPPPPPMEFDVVSKKQAL